MLENKYIAVPKPKNNDFRIKDGFYKSWNFPNLVGAIDGKHILIKIPPRLGSVYFSYKKTFRIVFMAIFDLKDRFTLVDIGDSGKQSSEFSYDQ